MNEQEKLQFYHEQFILDIFLIVIFCIVLVFIYFKLIQSDIDTDVLNNCVKEIVGNCYVK